VSRSTTLQKSWAPQTVGPILGDAEGSAVEWNAEQARSRTGFRTLQPSDNENRPSRELVPASGVVVQTLLVTSIPSDDSEPLARACAPDDAAGGPTATRTPDEPAPCRRMTMIGDRPAVVADRAEAGHWEGDLITGASNRSAIGTLVERTSRYVLLVHLPIRHTAHATRDGVLHVMGELPAELRRSLTWDQGKEMAGHLEITAATGMSVYFCEPHSPWQRGTNENTMGCSGTTSPRARTSPSTPPNTSSTSRTNSTTARARPWDGGPQSRPSLNHSRVIREPLLRRSLESALESA